jgi:hypothetical protein
MTAPRYRSDRRVQPTRETASRRPPALEDSGFDQLDKWTVACPAGGHAATGPLKPFLFLRHLGASLARLGKADCDRLFSALAFLAGTAALECAGLAFLHRALNRLGSAF